YAGATGSAAGEDPGGDDRGTRDRGRSACDAGVCTGGTGTRACSSMGVELGAAEGGRCVPHRDEAGALPAADGDDGSDGVCFDRADAEPYGREAEESAGVGLYAFG